MNNHRSRWTESRRPRPWVFAVTLIGLLLGMPLGGCVIRLASGAPPRDVRPAYTADQRSPPGEHRELEGGLFVLGGQARVTPPATGSEVPKR